jgi:hypothetical protein
MKKLRIQNSEFRIVICALALFCACKLKNTMFDGTDQPLGNGAGNLPQVASANPANAALLVDDDTLAAGIQGTVEIVFSDYLDPATVVAANIEVLNTSTGVLAPNLTLNYGPAARRLFIRGDNWQPNSAFLVTLKTGGIADRQGNALDGYPNQRNDGAPYDDFLTTFYTSGSGPGDCIATVPPRIAAIAPDTGRIDTAFPDISVSFTQGMDTLSLGNLNNIQLTGAAGAVQPLTIVLVNPFQLTVRPASPLALGQVYTVTLKSSELKAVLRANAPAFLAGLDADGNGAQAQEPDFKWYFLADTSLAPDVDSAVLADDHIQIDFTQLMDTASLTSGTVRVFDGAGYVPGTLHTSVTYEGFTRVDYYFVRPADPELSVFVSHRVKSRNGLLLDGNGNGVGGEPTDDYQEEI